MAQLCKCGREPDLRPVRSATRSLRSCTAAGAPRLFGRFATVLQPLASGRQSAQSLKAIKGLGRTSSTPLVMLSRSPWKRAAEAAATMVGPRPAGNGDAAEADPGKKRIKSKKGIKVLNV